MVPGQCWPPSRSPESATFFMAVALAASENPAPLADSVLQQGCFIGTKTKESHAEI